MKKTVKYCVFMIIIGFIISLALSLINEITSPIIEQQKIKKVEQLLLKVDNVNKWVSGETYININDEEYIDAVYVSLNEKNEYQVISYYTITKGYSNGNIEALIFIDYNKKEIINVEIISIENQTKGIGSLIKDDPNYVKIYENVKVKKYINDNINNHISDSIDVISGATISSRGVIQAVISACNNFNIIGGK